MGLTEALEKDGYLTLMFHVELLNYSILIQELKLVVDNCIHELPTAF